MRHILDKTFFERNTIDVAYELIGKELIVNQHQVKIIETEAYLGKDDPASHAFRGPTPRARIMFGPVGYFYVYLIYGMHYCLNIVAHEKQNVGAVLIRGISIKNQIISGPGRVCKILNIDKSYNNLNITTHANIYCLNNTFKPNVICTPRIGIRAGQEKPWRFVEQ